MSLSPAEINYVEIISSSTLVPTNHTVSSASLEMYSQSSWLGSSVSLNPLAETFPSDENITKIMSLEEEPWNDTYHHSSFLHGPTVMSTCI